MLDLQASDYFKTLPEFIRETVMQGGIDFNTEDELRAFVSNIERS